MQITHKNASASTSLAPNHAHYHSTLHAITRILDDEGLSGLYSGLHGSLLGVASTNFAYFYWYSVIRTLYISTQTLPTPPSTAIELSLGAAAGAVAQVFTIPVSVVTTRQQTQPKGERKGLVETGREVVESEDGWSGLWRGLKASLILVVNPAITYGAYQRLRLGLFPLRKELRPWEAFGELALCCCFVFFCFIAVKEGEEDAGDRDGLIEGFSARSDVEGVGDDCHAAVDCGEGGFAVAAAAGEAGEAV